MPEWLHMIKVKKGSIILADEPNTKECVVLGTAPSDAVLYIFESLDNFTRWQKKNGHKLPIQQQQQQAQQRIQMPPELAEMIKNQGLNPEAKTSAPKSSLEEEREKRRKKLMGEDEKGDYFAG